MAGRGTAKASIAARILSTSRSIIARSRAGRALNAHRLGSHK
jgi:hypothetical protein